MNIQRGITHCDTIGDIFKNPIFMRIVAKWYQINKDGDKLRWRQKSNGETIFTPQYYKFIREIFEDRTDMESFLAYLREVLLTSDTLYAKVKEDYSNSDIIKALLSFDELNDQLSTIDHLSVSGVFQTRIVDILRESYAASAHDEDPEEDVFPTISIFSALEKALDHGILPISSNGEVISVIDEGNTGYIVSVIGESRIFEVDKFGTPLDEEVIVESGSELLDTRKKVVTRIKLLERIISYHYNDSIDISEEDEQFYIDRKIEFTGEKESGSENLLEIHFGKYLIEMKNDLVEALKKMGSPPKRLEIVKNNNRDNSKTIEQRIDIPQLTDARKEKPKLRIIQ